MKFKALICIAMFSATLLAVSAACGDDDDSGAGSQTPVVSDTPRPQRPADFPEGYPEDFPLYPGAAYEQGTRHESAVLVLLTSPDARSTIADFYRERLQVEPWVLLSEVETNNGQNLLMTFRRDDEQDIRGSLTLATGSPGAGTTINALFAVPGLGEASPSATPAAPTESSDS